MRPNALVVRLVIPLLTAALVTACDDKEKPPSPAPATTASVPPPAAQPSSAPTPPPTPVPAGPVVELEVATVGDTMAFDKKTLSVPAGSAVHLKLKNNGTLAVMQHNWVLVTPGKEGSVASEGLAKAQKTGYVVPGPDVLASTPMAKPGETVEVTFAAPAAGTYAFICTYPGHYLSMHGTFTVTPVR